MAIEKNDGDWDGEKENMCMCVFVCVIERMTSE